MERFNKYNQTLFDHNRKIFGEEQEGGPLSTDNKEAKCKKCQLNATHIGSDFGRESYLCDDHAREFVRKRSSLPSDMYFCLTFDKVKEIDGVELRKPITFGSELVEYFHDKHAAAIKEQINFAGPAVCCVVKVKGGMCCQYGLDCGLVEVGILKSLAGQDIVDDEDVTANWANKKALFMFTAEDGRVVEQRYF